MADADELHAHVVIAAAGVNSFIAEEAGIRSKEASKHLAVGVKSVIGLPKKVIDGVAYAVVGDCTQTVAGGGLIHQQGVG